MVKYSINPEDQTKMVKARGNQLRTHFKNARETAAMLKNRDLKGAQKYLQGVRRGVDGQLGTRSAAFPCRRWSCAVEESAASLRLRMGRAARSPREGVPRATRRSIHLDHNPRRLLPRPLERRNRSIERVRQQWMARLRRRPPGVPTASGSSDVH